MARSIENIFTSLSSINDSLTKVIDQAKKMSADSSVFDGEIARVLGEQLNNYFIPTITKLRDDENTPGSMIGLSQFLDSIPLAMARQGFSSSEYNLPEVDEAEASAGIETPEGSAPVSLEDQGLDGEAEPAGAVHNEVDELPRGISYANPEGEQSEAEQTEKPVLTESYKFDDCISKAKTWDEFDDCIMSKSDTWFDKFCRAVDNYAKKSGKSDSDKEVYYKEVGLDVAKAIAIEISKRHEKKITEAYSKYRVIRMSTVGTALDEEVAKIEPTVVAEYDTEEEAKAVADKLNATVDAEEKDLLGTQYDVDCKEYNSEKEEA